MSRIIIDNRSGFCDELALNAVSEVIRMGRVSNNGKQYCYATTFDKVNVFTDLNKCSDRFVVTNAETQSN